MRPVKLSIKRARTDSDIDYYSVAIPKVIGDRYPRETWFTISVTETNKITLVPIDDVEDRL